MRHGDPQAGFTLIETLVALVLGLLAFAAILSFTVIGIHAQSSVANRAGTLADVQTTLAAMTREIRGADSAAYVASKGNRALALDGGAVTYDCSAAPCVRVAGGSQRTLLTSVTNADVFTLACVSASGEPTAGDALTMAPGDPAPAACEGGPASIVTVHLTAQVPCDGEGDAHAGTCPTNEVSVIGGVEMRGAGGHA